MSTKGIHFCLHISKHSSVQSSLTEVVKHRVFQSSSLGNFKSLKVQKHSQVLCNGAIHSSLSAQVAQQDPVFTLINQSENLVKLHLQLPPLHLFQHATLRITTRYEKSVCTSSASKQLTLRGPSLKTIYLWILQPMTTSCYH